MKIWITTILCCFTLSVFAQLNIEKFNKEGTIFYSDGTTEIGKLKAEKRKLYLNTKKDKKEIDINNVVKLEFYHKDGTVEKFAYVLSERNVKRNQRYLVWYIYEGENVDLFSEPVGSFGFVKNNYFVQKKGEPFAVDIGKKTKKLFNYLDCPSVEEQSDLKKIPDYVKYYDLSCL